MKIDDNPDITKFGIIIKQNLGENIANEIFKA